MLWVESDFIQSFGSVSEIGEGILWVSIYFLGKEPPEKGLIQRGRDRAEVNLLGSSSRSYNKRRKGY